MNKIHDNNLSHRMRVLDKVPTIKRRDFLRGMGIGAAGVTLIASTKVSASEEFILEEKFKNLNTEESEVLIRMARDIYPHDQLAEKFYIEAIAPYDSEAGRDVKTRKILKDGIEDLNQRATQAYGVNYTQIESEENRVGLLKSIEETPFFEKIQVGLRTGLYNNKDLWPLFGYEGSSWEKGGYINRGFDDIDWL